MDTATSSIAFQVICAHLSLDRRKLAIYVLLGTDIKAKNQTGEK